MNLRCSLDVFRMPEKCADLGSNRFISVDFIASNSVTHLKSAPKPHWYVVCDSRDHQLYANGDQIHVVGLCLLKCKRCFRLQSFAA